MFVRCLFAIYLILVSSLGYSQKENNTWIFGNHAGLNFNTMIPTSVKTSAVGSGVVYSTAISDKDGYLLFYTDGFTTWNNRHEVMPKRSHRWPWASGVMPLICPHPGNDSIYYIFGVSTGSYANRLQAIKINMNSNDGMGAIAYPDIPLDSINYYERLVDNASTFVAGTGHCNRKDFWVVTYANGSLYSFLIDSDGINHQPVITPVASSLIEPALYDGRNIKFSPNGERMVLPLIQKNKVFVFSFDNVTGHFFDPLKLDLPKDHYLTDVEFSPDGSKLYISDIIFEEEPGGKEYHTVGQMNLKLNDESAIENSYYSFNSNTPDEANWCTRVNCYFLDRTLALGPDGKIYVSMREVTGTTRERTITVIEEPNELGLQANYIQDKIAIKQQYQSIKYNYIRSLSYSPEKNGIQYKKNICADMPVNFSLLSGKADSVRWDFGDSPSGNNNFSKKMNPQHKYILPGEYKVVAIIFDRCTVDTAIAIVNILTDKTIKVPEFIKDSIICTGTELFMDATTPGATEYLWGGGNTKPVQRITVNGNYQVQVRNKCSVDLKRFKVRVQDCQCVVFVPNAFSPNYDGLNDFFTPIVKCAATDYRFTVYDRYGEKIFENTDFNQDGWGGKIGREPASNGIYIWMLQYRNSNTKKLISQKGSVTLIR